MTIALSIVGALAIVLVVILLHECGHFFVARAVGIQVERFSIGFGRPIWRHKAKSGIEYVLACLPLGGYVKMLGDHGDTQNKDPRAYQNKPLLARMAVVLAGPLVNLLLAWFVFWGIYTYGVMHVKPVVGVVQAGSIADKAGLRRGLEIVGVDHRRIHNWQQVLMTVMPRLGSHGTLQMKTRDESGVLSTHHLDLTHWRVDDLNPAPLARLGFQPFEPHVPPVISGVQAGSPAALAGLMVGDRMIALNGRSVTDWVPFVQRLQGLSGQSVRLVWQRGSRVMRKAVVLGHERVEGKVLGYLGATATRPPLPANMYSRLRLPIWQAWHPAFERCVWLLKFNVLSIWKMLQGDISVKALGGPISIFQVAGQATEAGWLPYLAFLAFISLMIGFVNLLPIPGLDGGHFFFQCLEGVMGKPVAAGVQIWSLRAGMVLLLCLMIRATVNDVMRLF